MLTETVFKYWLGPRSIPVEWLACINHRLTQQILIWGEILHTLSQKRGIDRLDTNDVECCHMNIEWAKHTRLHSRSRTPARRWSLLKLIVARK